MIQNTNNYFYLYKMNCFNRLIGCLNKIFICLFTKKSSEPIQWKDTVPFVPPIQSGEVIKVYDGDTITIASRMPYSNSPLYRFSVRLAGIDSPEIKAKTKIEKQLANNSKSALQEKIIGKTVELRNVSMEKYGRLLADVYCDGVHINAWMLQNAYAVPYQGKTKKRPPEWDDGMHEGTELIEIEIDDNIYFANDLNNGFIYDKDKQNDIDTYKLIGYIKKGEATFYDELE